jgi:hypothetical protein
MRLTLSTIVLTGLNAVLFGALAVQLTRGSQRDALLESAVPQAPIAPRKFDMPSAMVNLDSVQSRAVFYKSRNFYVAPASPVVEQPPPDYRLTGSMSFPNRPLTALLMHNQTHARVKVVSGDQLDGWTVSDVGPRRVVVQLGERSAEIGSAAVSRSPGVTIVSNGQTAIPSSPSTGIVRVPAGTGATRPTALPPPGASSNEKPRLYRPPSG